MASETDRRHGPDYHDAMLIAAGVADVAYSGVRSLLGSARGLLDRSDKSALAGDGTDELRARGHLALARLSPSKPAYLEVLARHAEHGRGRPDA